MMSSRIDRRTLLFAGCASAALAADSEPTTHVYKTTTGGHQIKADVYRPGGSDSRTRPVVVWIHGGALINGNRAGISAPVKRWALETDSVLVSIDYRLAPETQLPEIVRDIEDAFAWVRRDGPRLFRVDPKRVAVAGGSAGGFLTLVTGYRVNPRPTVLLSLWGYGDLVGDWYSTPSPHARHQGIKVTREEAYRQVSGPVVSDSRDRKGDGGAFYRHCRQNGTWPAAVSGWDPKREERNFYPYMPVKNVTRDYPPTVLIHGTADTDVPYEQSTLMAAEFAKHDVRHELISIPGAEHGLSGGDKTAVDAAYRNGFMFLNRAMGF
ncbi:MAG: alpha/beta hydrolase [Bryobacteraceae bacterium]